MRELVGTIVGLGYKGETRHLSSAVHQSRSKFFFPLTCIIVVSGLRGGCIPPIIPPSYFQHLINFAITALGR